ncbi:DUF1295 domain-containing protein [Psychrobacter sp. Ps1]|uniref:methyltransferase family protein n=1 Tax=Psychrobacter sp. Ps1 TaxID=2790955 RepID=UPI001EE1112F|nr:DUF1295 domain-containing protein [Psychrobacter sp. Ps1]MCG3842867.1 DUF1295 domain-containing protein [Psychrobacter sp. Ps1]
MMVSVHQHPRQASIILIMSFFLWYLISKILLIDYLSLDALIRVWLLACLLPLFIVAYIQNPHRKKHPLNPINSARIKSKSIVFLSQLVGIYLYAFIVTESGVSIYATFVNDLFLFFPLVMVVSVGYIYFVDRRLLDPEDEYAKIGAMLNKNVPVDRALLKTFILKTVVKFVFIPFMYSGFLGNLAAIFDTAWQFNATAITLLIFNIVISLDMLIAIFGYLFSSGIINNRIVDTDSNILGWIFALLCYPPLVWIMRQVNDQQDNLIWQDIIPQDSVFYWLFLLAINVSWIVYWLATFEFGMTFSNLSWRRLIDTGVYRYTKHPAYIAKNIYWWLYTLPFMGVAFASVQWWQNILGLTFVSLIYYGRAKSEERHLRKFVEYRQYCDQIDQTGIFRWLKKMQPTY